MDKDHRVEFICPARALKCSSRWELRRGRRRPLPQLPARDVTGLTVTRSEEILLSARIVMPALHPRIWDIGTGIHPLAPWVRVSHKGPKVS